MTPENKTKAKEKIIELIKNKYSTYPEIEPKLVLNEIPAMYKMLVEEKLIDSSDLPFDHFQYLVIDKYREASIIDQLNSFF